MQRLTEIAFEKASHGIFTRAEVSCWVGGSQQRQFSLVKRALASGEIVHVRRGLYCLAAKYLRQKVDPLVLAQRLYGPSYISLETALSYHDWIPEAVYAITSTSHDRSREFDTPLGHFSFTRVPQTTFYAEVARVEKESGSSFLLASPLKALTDYVHVHKRDWNSSRPVVESLRVDEGLLASVEGEAFDLLLANYPSLRVRRFLKGLRKDLKR
jgi:phage terminase large subunit-like protein